MSRNYKDKRSTPQTQWHEDYARHLRTGEPIMSATKTYTFYPWMGKYPRQNSPWPIEEVNEVVNRFKAGEKLKDIARRHGKKLNVILMIAIHHIIELRSNPYQNKSAIIYRRNK